MGGHGNFGRSELPGCTSLDKSLEVHYSLPVPHMPSDFSQTCDQLYSATCSYCNDTLPSRWIQWPLTEASKAMNQNTLFLLSDIYYLSRKFEYWLTSISSFSSHISSAMSLTFVSEHVRPALVPFKRFIFSHCLPYSCEGRLVCKACLTPNWWRWMWLISCSWLHINSRYHFIIYSIGM